MLGSPTLDEAIDACDTLKRFLEGLDATFRSSRVRNQDVPRPEPEESARKAAEHGNSKTPTWLDAPWLGSRCPLTRHVTT